MFRSLAFLVCAFSCFCLSACDGGARDEVRAVFDAYNAALRAHDGAGFLKLIDPENIKNYGRTVEVARTGDRNAIERLSTGDKAVVTQLRNNFTAQELSKMDGAEYVRMSVNRGWFFKEEDGMRFTLGLITVKKPRASAWLLVDGVKSDLRFEFVEVEHQWLVNDECMSTWIDREIEEDARASRMSVDTYILEVESMESGKKVTREIWENPPR